MKSYLLFDYGIFDDNCNGFSYYLGSFDSYPDAEKHYIEYLNKLKNTNNSNINDSREHGFYIWHDNILYLYVCNDLNSFTIVQQKKMINTFTKRYLYHPIFFMSGSICYDGILFESDDLIDCQEDTRFEIFWYWDDLCDEFHGDIVCLDTVLDVVTKIKIYDKKEYCDESDSESEINSDND